MCNLINACRLERDGHRGNALLASSRIDRIDIDLLFRKHAGNVRQQTSAVMCEQGNLCDIALVVGACLRHLPFRLDHTVSLDLRKVQNVDAVRAMNRDTAATGHEADDLIPGDRITALGEVNRHVVNAFHHNSALGFLQQRLLALRDCLQDLLVCDLAALLLLLLF